MTDSEMFIVRSRGMWAAQARAALDRLRAAGAAPDAAMFELDEIDHEAFCSLIEAMHALDPDSVNEELLARAQMRPLKEGF
jgi:hypothetical protein